MCHRWDVECFHNVTESWKIRSATQHNLSSTYFPCVRTWCFLPGTTNVVLLKVALVFFCINVVQLTYSPRVISSCGLTDGEATERLWSYLRRFAKYTKEMKPSHRV